MGQEKQESESRRDFLKKTGKAAVAIPAATVILTAAHVPNVAAASSGGRASMGSAGQYGEYGGEGETGDRGEMASGGSYGDL